MRRPSSVLTPLLIGFAVFAILIGGATVVNYTAVARQNSVAQQVTGRFTVLQQEETALESAYGTAQFAVIFYNATGQRSYLLPLSTVRSAFDSNLAALRRNATPGLRGLVEVQATAGAAWFALAPRLAAVTPRTPAARAVYAQTNQLSVSFLTALTAALTRLHSDIERLTASSKHALSTGLLWSAVALGVALLLLLVASLSIVYTVTRPLRALTATVGLLTRGDHAARAAVRGSPEVRQVARAVNTQADEADRLRATEAESNRLRAAAREAGVRIRETLAAADVLRETRLALQRVVSAQRVAVRLFAEGGEIPAPPLEAELGPEIAPEVRPHLPERVLTELRALFAAQTSEVTQDVQGPEGDMLPPGLREAIRGLGVTAQIITPFGAGGTMLGMLVVERIAPDRRQWTAAEVDAVESIAGDLGRGLNHARLYEAEGKLVADLQSLDRAKSDFFATVSHELRSPLTTIEGYVEMLADDPGGRLDAEQQHMVEAIDRGAARLRGLIEDVFTLAKLESGAFAAERQPVAIAGLVSSAVEAVQPSVTEKQLSLTVAAPGSGLVVSGDPGQLERVLLNLLSNAVKFTPAGGTVTVGAAADGDSAVISVADTGIGIPPADQQNLFSRFHRASNAIDKKIPGTGLGLAIVRTIVVNHGGTIGVESREGAGTTMTVRLPRQGTGGD